LNIDEDLLWEEYVKGKQTYAQLAEKYRCSIRTIQRKLDNYSVKKQLKNSPKGDRSDGYNLLGKRVWRYAF
jgi:hypothetical protein